MDQQTFEAAMGDVASRFRTPQALFESRDCDKEQKIALLRQWEHDLRLMMVATEENMGAQMPQQKPGGSAEAFQAVRKALDKLGATETEGAGAGKLGGGSPA